MDRYRSREDAYSNPRPLRIDDNGMFVFEDGLRASARPPVTAVEAAMSQKPRRTFQEPGLDATLLGAAAEPAVPPGTAVIDIDLECGRHLWIRRSKSSNGSFLARAWTKPPRVEIDGVPQPSGWGHWRYAVGPGPHRVAVAVDGRPLNLTVPEHHTGEPGAREAVDVTARPGAATRLRAEAHVFAIWRAGSGRVESYQPRLRIDAEMRRGEI